MFQCNKVIKKKTSNKFDLWNTGRIHWFSTLFIITMFTLDIDVKVADDVPEAARAGAEFHMRQTKKLLPKKVSLRLRVFFRNLNF